ncbi:MAG TPA: tetratricopeptide repeat protein, partial [Rubrivivax sp.]|nr:tetratricopeptide repeat protein [Rubrivivax sp.]
MATTPAHSKARRTGIPAVQREAQRAWRLLHTDATASIRLAEASLVRALETRQAAGEAWARLARGFHTLYFAAPAEAFGELLLARECFQRVGDRAGEILAIAGQGRALWRSGRVEAAQALLLPLRDEGARLLKHEQRGVLLNAIAGCYSAQGRSEEAFAYMYEALRCASPRRAHGFDAALHCNLSHELLQLGDCDEALAQVDRGIARCERMHNTRLLAMLLINRVICLTELGRADEALPDVQRICALPIDASGRGTTALHFETLAITASRAGRADLADELLSRARDSGNLHLPDEQVEFATA